MNYGRIEKHLMRDRFIPISLREWFLERVIARLVRVSDLPIEFHWVEGRKWVYRPSKGVWICRITDLLWGSWILSRLSLSFWVLTLPKRDISAIDAHFLVWMWRESEPFYGEKTDLSSLFNLDSPSLAWVMLVERGRVKLEGLRQVTRIGVD